MVWQATCRKQVAEKGCSEERFHPVLQRNFAIKHHRQPELSDVTVLPFSQSVLLRRVRARDLLSDPIFLQVRDECRTDELSTSVTLKGANSTSQLILY